MGGARSTSSGLVNSIRWLVLFASFLLLPIASKLIIEAKNLLIFSTLVNSDEFLRYGYIQIGDGAFLIIVAILGIYVTCSMKHSSLIWCWVTTGQRCVWCIYMLTWLADEIGFSCQFIKTLTSLKPQYDYWYGVKSFRSGTITNKATLYTNLEATLIWDSVQRKFECCGLQSKDEWLEYSPDNLTYPQSCCSEPKQSERRLFFYYCPRDIVYNSSCSAIIYDQSKWTIIYTVLSFAINLVVLTLLAVVARALANQKIGETRAKYNKNNNNNKHNNNSNDARRRVNSRTRNSASEGDHTARDRRDGRTNSTNSRDRDLSCGGHSSKNNRNINLSPSGGDCIDHNKNKIIELDIIRRVDEDHNRTNKYDHSIACTNLTITSLPLSMTEDSLLKLFSPIGEIKTWKLVRNKENYRPVGHGYVDYVRPEDAETAIKKINGLRFDDKIIKVKYARLQNDPSNDPTLFVSGLPKSVNLTDLESLFSKYGPIISSSVARFGRSGFVKLASMDLAEQAIADLNDMQFKDSNDKSPNKSSRLIVKLAQ